MEKLNAVITGVGGYVPEYVLGNEELSRMVDTNDEWIMSRVGIKERRILNEEGLGTSYMARKAVKQLLAKTGTDPLEVDALIVADLGVVTLARAHAPHVALHLSRAYQRLLLRPSGCLQRIHLRYGPSCQHDTEWTIQEDSRLWSRKDVEHG